MKDIISVLRGGLGNQLFAYAAGWRLATSCDFNFVVDPLSGFRHDIKYKRKYQLSRFQITSGIATPKQRLEPFSRARRRLAILLNRDRPFNERTYIKQTGVAFVSEMLLYRPLHSVILDGYWQSEDYFKDCIPAIRREFSIIPPLDRKNQSLANRMQACNSVAVHVRFFDESHTNSNDSRGNNILPQYYYAAIEVVRSRVKNPTFFVFSDRPDLAARLISSICHSYQIVDHNRGDLCAVDDLWLMTQCRHHVIANSTFSWWGAWLAGDSSSLVISPGTVHGKDTSWGFDRLIPARWNVIEP